MFIRNAGSVPSDPGRERPKMADGRLRGSRGFVPRPFTLHSYSQKQPESKNERDGLMNTGFISCGGACLLCLLFALIFTIFKEKSAMLISGFNTMPKEKRELYDKKKMCRDQRNAFLIWAVILGTGAVLSYYISKYFAAAAFVIFLIIFFKDVHLDEEKAFEKYKNNL